MGSHRYLYLGPYVECTYRKETREVVITSCTNTKCAEHTQQRSRGEKFCAKCGSPIGPTKKQEPYFASIYDVFGDREQLASLGYDPTRRHLWLGSNIRGTRNFHPEDECQIDMAKIDQAGEMSWFKDEFAEDLKLLRGAYDNVTIKWGLISYYM